MVWEFFSHLIVLDSKPQWSYKTLKAAEIIDLPNDVVGCYWVFDVTRLLK